MSLSHVVRIIDLGTPIILRCEDGERVEFGVRIDKEKYIFSQRERDCGRNDLSNPNVNVTVLT